MNVLLEKYKPFLIGIVVIVLASIIYVSQPDKEFVNVQTNQPLAETEILSKEPDPVETNERLYVDVKGAVQNPGIYEVEEGDRVFDVIEQSGGLLEEADENQVNFAQKLYDEMVVYIPKAGEEFNTSVMNDSSTASENKSVVKVNINKANATELETLPGIGPSKATAIIEYREQNGPFKQIEDIQQISGIGEKTFERLEGLITVH